MPVEAALRLPSAPASVEAARHHSRNFAAHLPVPVDIAMLVVSELVTNAICHGTEPIGLRLAWDGHALAVEVSDGDPDVGQVVARATRNGDGEHGMGLRIVEHLALAWGTRATATGLGKTVWATIAEADVPLNA